MLRPCHQLIGWILLISTTVHHISGSSQAATWNPAHCPTACICRLENSVRKVYCDIQNKQRELTAVPSNFPSDSQFISLGDNKIPTIPVGAFSNLLQLRDLLLDGNGLQSLPRDVFRGLANLKSLNLANNRLSVLPSGLFKGLSTLRDLYLDGNVLENLPNDFFEGLKSLRRLQLHGNKFHAFSKRVFGFRGEFQTFTIDNQDSMKLRRLTPSMLGNISSLSELTLNHNGIHQVQHGSFDRMAVLKRLKLNDNNISILPHGLFRDLKSLKFLSLYNNPFQCTCALKWLKHWILRYSKSVHVFYKDMIKCNGPSPVRGRSLIKLTNKEFGCKRKQWTEWSSWSTCSGSCGAEKQSQRRTRRCMGHASQLKCKGYDTNWRECACEIGWNEWSTWTPCSVSCSVGYQTRNRRTNCTRSPCQRHLESEVKACVREPCSRPSDWTSWSMCDKLCGQGRQNRTRACLERGGPCSHRQTRECKVRECVEWASWSTWSACGNNCSEGVQARKRDCIVVVGLRKQCPGSGTEERPCSKGGCLVHGGWSPWQQWTSCSATCGLGFKIRQRNCTRPAPRHGGTACRGRYLEVTQCAEDFCTDEFSPWSAWSKCSTECGKGVQSRSRNCTTLDPVSGIGLCLGSREEFQECEVEKCNVAGFWGDWSRWGKCLGDCNRGMRLRWRFCMNSHGFYTNTCQSNQTFEYQKEHCRATSCSYNPVWSNWSNWSACSKSCGSGSRRRWRFCLTKVIGQQCPGSFESKQSCNTHACPIHGSWSTWSTWSKCSRNCGGGIQQRNRTCNNPLPQNNGQKCLGDKFEVLKCNMLACREQILGDEAGTSQVDLTLNECREPAEHPKNGRYSLKKQKDGFSYLQYRCDQLFHNDRESTIRHCTTEGKWSGDPAECVPDCGELHSGVIPGKRLTRDHSIMSLDDSWPWQAAIHVDKRGVLCGGSLVGDQWIITAAHCVINSVTKMKYKGIQVYLGTNNLQKLNSPEVQKIEVVEIYNHSAFEWKVYESDIAILRLKEKVNITSWVHPVCLPKKRHRRHLIKKGRMGVMVGWGSQGKQDYLRQIPLPVVSLKTCKESYTSLKHKWTVTTNMFCAGFKDGHRDTCQRDSGGGFLFLDKKKGRKPKWVLGGIVSWGYPKCGEQGKYSVFTNVAKHMDWINDKIEYR